jgi:two-component system, response regulator PdtaR
MAAAGIFEEAGFEVLEARTLKRRSSCWRPDAISPSSLTDIEVLGSMDGLRLTQAVRGRWPLI